jgi:hypothetical protein
MLPLGELKNCIELEKTGQLTHLPVQTTREQIPCFSMIFECIEEEVNWSWAAENKLHANKPRGRKDATKIEKPLYNNQPKA